MSNELFTFDGKRKYLTQDEQDRFLKAASDLDRAEVRTFCMTLAFTGCRISEALQLTVARVDLSAKVIRFRTLKKRDKVEYRAVPVPDDYLDAMKLVHSIAKRQKLKTGKDALLWDFKRAMAWKHIKAVMQAAGIEGAQATAKGLRHGFGVRMAQKTRNPRLVQKLLGHSSLETTVIYMDLVGEEERAEVLGAW
ncbi:MAG: site-specific integrase [Gammaproteobacteria bacterium]|nr:site-specific integrase [Gammaproteobacteria bacterium]